MSDTPPAVARRQREALRTRTGEDRLALAVEMSLTARTLLVARLKGAHPGWSNEEVTRELLRRTLHPSELPASFR